MKTRPYLILILLIGISTGCTPEQIVDSSTTEACIYGNHKPLYTDESPTSRTQEILDDGTTLSFYATEGIHAENQTLTLSHSFWSGSSNLLWEHSPLPANVTGYSPYLPALSEDFYHSDGKLKDLLFCKAVYPYLSDIELQFHHLFARLDFVVSPELNDALENITLTPSLAVENIEPYSAKINTRPANSHERVCYSRQGNRVYSLIVPPSADCSILLELELTTGKRYSKQLSHLSCESGRCYQASVKEHDEQIGIFSSEDFIAFSHLINNQPYKGRELKEFGTVKDGITTYSLKRDICFTDEERARILQISPYINKGPGVEGFDDIFDGENHVLQNLWLASDETDFSALFQHLGKSGVVKNLTLIEATAQPKGLARNNAILCGLNEGKIDNCHIRRSSIKSSKRAIAALVGVNEGKVINSSVKELQIELTPVNTETRIECGAIIKDNTCNGTILNCYAEDLTLKKSKKLNEQVSVLAFVNNGTISNCYSNRFDKDIQALCYYNNNDRMDWCYFPKERYNKHVAGKGSSYTYLNQQHIHVFTETAQDYKSVINLLNQWIPSIGAERYPNLTFLTWKTEGELDISFDSF